MAQGSGHERLDDPNDPKPGREIRPGDPRCARVVRVQIANRFDIGGFTDIDPSRAGAVLSFPILINEKPITVIASVRDSQPDDLIISLKSGVPTDLVEHVARSFVERYRVRGVVTVEVECATPQGSGAGASSQISAAVVAALAGCNGMDASRPELAREAYRLETTKTSCGWQDQAPVVIGRCGFITAEPAASAVAVVPEYLTVPVGEAVLVELEQRGVLVWTGQSHFSKKILDAVKSRLSCGAPCALGAWDTLYSLANQARDTLVGDGPAEACVDGLASIVAANWAAELELSDGMVATEELIALDPQLRKLGSYKLLGAGRGGFLFFIGRRGPDTTAAIELLGGVPGWKVEQWRIDRVPARIDSLDS